MNKFVLIITGGAGVGKDTFVNTLTRLVGTEHISIVDQTKRLARMAGWHGEKTEKDRKFLSDLKLLVDEYNNNNYNYCVETAKKFLSLRDGVKKLLCIDMREKKDVDPFVSEFGKDLVKIVRVENNRVAPINSNIADRDVVKIEPDFVIENNGSIHDLEQTAKEFLKTLGVKVPDSYN